MTKIHSLIVASASLAAIGTLASCGVQRSSPAPGTPNLATKLLGITGTRAWTMAMQSNFTIEAEYKDALPVSNAKMAIYSLVGSSYKPVLSDVVGNVGRAGEITLGPGKPFVGRIKVIMSWTEDGAPKRESAVFQTYRERPMKTPNSKLTSHETEVVTNYFGWASRHHDFMISASTLYRWMYVNHKNVQIIDVRQPSGPDGFAFGHIVGAENVPLQVVWMEVASKKPFHGAITLPSKTGAPQTAPLTLTPLSKSEPIVVMCYDGDGGEMVPSLLRVLGYHAYSLQDGISTWNKALNVWPTRSQVKPLPTTTKGVSYAGPSPATDPVNSASTLKSAVIKTLKSLNRIYAPGYLRPFTITPSELMTRMNSVEPPMIIDVRSPAEYSREHIPSSINIPFDDLGMNLSRLPKHRQIILVSGHMQKSAQACILLRMLGYNTFVLQQGLALWNPTFTGNVPTNQYPLTTTS